jgi:membrane-associated HD superfamily phosphohydrolase
MKYENATADEVKKAQAPHNLFVSCLFLFDLMMTPAVLAFKVGLVGLLVPLLCSCTLIAYIYQRSRKTTTWFVDAHWKLAFARGQLLLLGYALTAALIFIAWLISFASSDHNMRHIIWTALTRIALMPTLIMVMVTAVMEFGGAAQAVKHEVPDKLAAKFPPPSV